VVAEFEIRRGRLVREMASKNESGTRKIVKYRRHAMLSAADEVTRKRIAALISELEQKLREIDE
jgi:hypothetical protein